MTSVALGGVRSPSLRSPVLSASAAELMNARMIATKIRIAINERSDAKFPKLRCRKGIATTEFRPHVILHETV